MKALSDLAGLLLIWTSCSMFLYPHIYFYCCINYVFLLRNQHEFVTFVIVQKARLSLPVQFPQQDKQSPRWSRSFPQIYVPRASVSYIHVSELAAAQRTLFFFFLQRTRPQNTRIHPGMKHPPPERDANIYLCTLTEKGSVFRKVHEFVLIKVVEFKEFTLSCLRREK